MALDLCLRLRKCTCFSNTQSLFFVISEYNQPRVGLLKALAHLTSSQSSCFQSLLDFHPKHKKKAKLTLTMDRIALILAWISSWWLEGGTGIICHYNLLFTSSERDTQLRVIWSSTVTITNKQASIWRQTTLQANNLRGGQGSELMFPGSRCNGSLWSPSAVPVVKSHLALHHQQGQQQDSNPFGSAEKWETETLNPARRSLHPITAVVIKDAGVTGICLVLQRIDVRIISRRDFPIR